MAGQVSGGQSTHLAGLRHVIGRFHLETQDVLYGNRNDWTDIECEQGWINRLQIINKYRNEWRLQWMEMKTIVMTGNRKEWRQ